MENSVTPMEVDTDEESGPSVLVSPIGSTTSLEGRRRPRKPPTIVRREGQSGKATKLEPLDRKKRGQIYYYDSRVKGSGATAIVYEGYFKTEDTPAAIKRVFSEHFEICRRELDIWKEVGFAQKTVESFNIIPLYDWMEYAEGDEVGKPSHYFAMELGKCNLSDRVNNVNAGRDDIATTDPALHHQKLIGFLKDTASGLGWLHSKKIIHRDMKPENVLIFSYDGGKEVAKIGDFGISRKISTMSTGTNSVGKGTTDWMSPEALRALQFEEEFPNKYSMDIFSLGMTAHFTISGGEHPFHFSTKYGTFKPQNIQDPTVEPPQLPETHTAGNHLCQWMISKEEGDRPKIAYVMKHPLFWNVKKCFKFIFDVARAVDGKDEQFKGIVDRLYDRLYRKLYLHIEDDNDYSSYFDWGNILGDQAFTLLRGRESATKLSNYNTRSLMSLLTLVRDKHVHYPDLKKELLQDKYFGEQGLFSEKKYAEYFVSRFPDFVIFFYTVLAQPWKGYSFINSLKRNNYIQSDIPLLPPLKRFFKNGECQVARLYKKGSNSMIEHEN